MKPKEQPQNIEPKKLYTIIVFPFFHNYNYTHIVYNLWIT